MKREELGTSQSYLNELGRAKARASVEPVIVAKLVDFDAPSIGLLSLMRHCLCHHRLVGVTSVGGDAIVIREEVGRNVEMLLQREFGGGVGGVSEDGKRRHFVGWWARDHNCARCRGWCGEREEVDMDGGGGPGMFCGCLC